MKTMEEKLVEEIRTLTEENKKLKAQLTVTQSALDAVLMGELEEIKEA